MAQELAAGYCAPCCPTHEPCSLPDALEGGTAYAVACAARNNTSPLQGSPAGFRTVH